MERMVLVVVVVEDDEVVSSLGCPSATARKRQDCREDSSCCPLW